MLNVKENDKISKGDILTEWDPFTLPIIAQKKGYVVAKDLEDGVSTREVIDESTGLSSKTTIDWNKKSKNKSLTIPRIEIHDKQKNGKILKLDNGSPVAELPVDSSRVVRPQIINEGVILLLEFQKNHQRQKILLVVSQELQNFLKQGFQKIML